MKYTLLLKIRMLKDFNKETFDKYLNTNFVLKISEEQEIALELIEIRDRKVEGFDAFTLILRGPGNIEIWDNTYTFKHENIGEISMFISPYKKKAEYIYYDVNFSIENVKFNNNF